MSTILRKGIIRGGQVVVGEPINLPDGSEVTITGSPHFKFVGLEDNDLPDSPVAFDIEFQTEDERYDDPVVIREWIDDLRTIPAVPETSDEEADRRAWEERMRLFNIEAVRKQFEAGGP
jgi:hypothetical protein